jgi:putative MATE family efflux protein
MSELNKTDNVKTLLGDPKKAVLKLSIPAIIAMIINSSYSFIDGIWISGLGDMALAGVGFVNPLYLVVFGFSNGIGAGATSVVSRYIGANNKKEADNSATHVLLLTVIISIIFMVIILTFLRPLLEIMDAGSTINLGMDYGSTLFIGTIFIVFSTTAYGILRAEGKGKKITYAMLFGVILNIILDPIFIYALNLGVKGAAITTIISMASVSFLLLYWFKTDTYIKFNIKNFIFKHKIIKEILSIGLPAGIEFFLVSLLAISLNTILMTVSGVDGVAIYTGGWRFIAIIIVIPTAIGISTIAITGANLGAENFKNINTTHDYAIKFATIIVIIISIAIFALAPHISYLFAYTPGSERLLAPMTEFLQVTCLFYLFFPLGVISSSVFQGLGKGLNSLTASFLRVFILQILCSYIFAVVLNLGQEGVWYGMVLGNAIGGIIAYMWSRIYIKKLIKENGIKKIS